MDCVKAEIKNSKSKKTKIYKIKINNNMKVKIVSESLETFVSESLQFQRSSDPRKILNLGYGNKVNTKAWKILEFIGSKGEEGASLTEIQYFIAVTLGGMSEEDFFRKGPMSHYTGPGLSDFSTGIGRQSRGNYCTNLYGSSYGKQPDEQRGLLHKYCYKNPTTKKWVLKRMPEPGENIY